MSKPPFSDHHLPAEEKKPTLDELLEVANATVKNLAKLGIKSATFGSLACFLFGAKHRIPGDVDIIMITIDDEWDGSRTHHCNIERIKRLVTKKDPSHFYLISPTKEPGRSRKRFKKLFYKLPPHPCKPKSRRCCKVDILFYRSQVISIDPFPMESLSYRRENPNGFGIPVVPLATLIALKLKGWEQRPTTKAHQLEKRQFIDPGDIKELLVIANRENVNLRQIPWLSKWFKQETRRRVKAFVKMYPETSDQWKQLGVRV